MSKVPVNLPYALSEPIEQFLAELELERGLSHHTIAAYGRDLYQVANYFTASSCSLGWTWGQPMWIVGVNRWRAPSMRGVVRHVSCLHWGCWLNIWFRRIWYERILPNCSWARSSSEHCRKWCTCLKWNAYWMPQILRRQLVCVIGQCLNCCTAADFVSRSCVRWWCRM